jgi:hypothetical protein
MHDRKRKEAQNNAKWQFNTLIKNNKYFVAPQKEADSFKQLFARLAAAGAGRPVDAEGFPDGPWTPEKLTDAISSFEANEKGIEVRAVQVWFQDNSNGISNENIRWLARIFGCDDPEATAQWQTELNAARERLASERREKRRRAASTEAKSEQAKALHGNFVARLTFAELSERAFRCSGPFNLIVALWVFVSMLLFVAYLAGVHDVLYSPVEGVSKQVGLFWSPNWYIDDLVLVPLLMIVVSNTVTRWRDESRGLLVSEQIDPEVDKGWRQRRNDFAFTFQALFLASLFIIFFLQWYGAYLTPLQENDVGQRVVDWLLIAIERPDVMSIPFAKYLSMMANFTSGISYWCCFTGLLLLYIVVTDFKDVCGRSAPYYDPSQYHEAMNTARTIMQGIYRCAILMLIASTAIKLVATYLMTDAENLAGWLLKDARSLFGLTNVGWSWFDKSPAASITSFFVMFIPVFVFFVCLSQIYVTLRTLLNAGIDQSNAVLLTNSNMLDELKAEWFNWSIVIALFVANFWLIGRFTGFSILLFGSLAIGVYSIISTTRFQAGENTL